MHLRGERGYWGGMGHFNREVGTIAFFIIRINLFLFLGSGEEGSGNEGSGNEAETILPTTTTVAPTTTTIQPTTATTVAATETAPTTVTQTTAAPLITTTIKITTQASTVQNTSPTRLTTPAALPSSTMSRPGPAYPPVQPQFPTKTPVEMNKSSYIQHNVFFLFRF